MSTVAVASSAPPLAVLSVASEVYPLVKTGGLADVAGALPGALAPLGLDVRTLVPGYPAVLAATADGETIASWPDWYGGPAKLVAARVAVLDAVLDTIVLDAPHLYDRPGNPYVDEDGRDRPDNAVRFASLAAAAARIGRGDVDAFVPDVLHLHDWQAALAAVFVAFAADARPRPATVLTIHNLAFQGRFPPSARDAIGLPDAAYASHGVEWYGDVGFLKGGILFADAVTTVSPTYAREILGPAGGMEMDAMLRWRGDAVSGIVNGIDTAVWNPATDPLLARRYDAGRLYDRSANARAVETRFGLDVEADAGRAGLLVAMITRLTTQKGIDLVVDALDALVADGVRFAILGTGEPWLESALRDASARHRGRVGVEIGYDEALAHRMQGGCDAILVPSRFEPCGLTQLCGLRYGCVPIVTRTGGLADTVIDANDAALKAGFATGVLADAVTTDGVVDAVRRARDLHRRREAWRRVQRAGMRADVGWAASAGEYAALFRRLAAAHATA